MLSRSHRIRHTTSAERAAKRQRRENNRAFRANLVLVLAGREPTVEPELAVDLNFLAFVHTLPCCAEGLPGHNCRGEIEADHIGERGYGAKCIDRESIPLAKGCHDDRHASEGPFSLDLWTFDERRAWLDARIADTQAAYAAHLAGPAPP